MDNKVMIVDEQTGRIMDGRRYSMVYTKQSKLKKKRKNQAATQTFATGYFTELFPYV